MRHDSNSPHQKLRLGWGLWHLMTTTHFHSHCHCMRFPSRLALRGLQQSSWRSEHHGCHMWLCRWSLTVICHFLLHYFFFLMCHCPSNTRFSGFFEDLKCPNIDHVIHCWHKPTPKLLKVYFGTGNLFLLPPVNVVLHTNKAAFIKA